MSKLGNVDQHVIEYLMHVSIGCGPFMVRLSSIRYNRSNMMKIKVLM